MVSHDSHQSVDDDVCTVLTADNINRVDKCILADRHAIARDIAAELSMNVGSVEKIIPEHLKLREVSARWVPRQQRYDAICHGTVTWSGSTDGQSSKFISLQRRSWLCLVRQSATQACLCELISRWFDVCRQESEHEGSKDSATCDSAGAAAQASSSGTEATSSDQEARGGR